MTQYVAGVHHVFDEVCSLNLLGQVCGVVGVRPFISLIAVTLGGFLIIPPFVSVYRTGQRIGDAQRAAGLSSTCTPVLGLVLAFVFSLYSLYYQAEMNKIVDAYPGATTGQPVPLGGA